MALRILMIIPALDYCNGITSYAMNYYRHLNKNNFQIDFAVHYNFDTDYKKEILQDGNKVFFMGDYSIKSMIGLKKRICDLFKTNHYDIVHCHVLNVAYFYLKEAKKNNICCRILHSHATKNSENKLKNIRNYFLKKLGLKYATHKFACSVLAGNYLFHKDYVVINNAIDCDKYRFSYSNRLMLQRKYMISEEQHVFGFVGRLVSQKNIPFLIKIIKSLSYDSKNVFFIVGDGIYKNEIISLQNQLGCEKIHYIDATPNVNIYYSLFDCLLLPSLFEGLPVTGVEAQISGCKVLCSDTITRELNFSGKCSFIKLNDLDAWLKEINNFSNDDRVVKCEDYDINYQSLKLEQKYKEIVGDRYE